MGLALEPILAMKRIFKIKAGERITVNLITAVAEARN
jgi:hypothetical protein